MKISNKLHNTLMQYLMTISYQSFVPYVTRTILRYARFMAWAVRLCLWSVTLLRPTQRVKIFGNIFAPSNSLGTACLGGAVGSVAVRAAWLRWSPSLGSRPRLAESLCQIIAAYALRLNSPAGTERSTLSSLICDRWLILGSETLSISRCLKHW